MLWLISKVGSVKVPPAWHSPQRSELKLGFLSDRLDPRKKSIPSKGSGVAAVCARVPAVVVTNVHPVVPSGPGQLILATRLGSRLNLPTSWKQGCAPPVSAH